MQLVLVVVAILSIYALVKAFKGGRIISALLSLVIGALALILLYGLFVIQLYSPDTMLVARVRATVIANSKAGYPQMSLDVTLYDHGRITSDAVYVVEGDRWELQGDVLKVSGLLSALGFHSGFKLTRLEGRYNDPNLEANATHSVVSLNGGDDAFFQIGQFFTSAFPSIIQATYGNAVQNGAGSYKIYASQSSMWAQAA
jgi:hypothetical protein